MITASPNPAYEGLLYTVFQRLRQPGESPDARALVIALTSANPGEGVTHSIQALLTELGRDSASRTLLVDARDLNTLTLPPGDLAHLCLPLPGPFQESIFRLADPSSTPHSQLGPYSWKSSWEYRKASIDALRELFDYVLIDCPALAVANDVLSLAPFVDGSILVVQADKTRKEQILYAEKAIQFARGKVIGHILNKRTYVVPGWLYRRL